MCGNWWKIFLIFVPFGVYAGMLVKERSWWKVILAGAGFSLILETLQYGVRNRGK